MHCDTSLRYVLYFTANKIISNSFQGLIGKQKITLCRRKEAIQRNFKKLRKTNRKKLDRVQNIGKIRTTCSLFCDFQNSFSKHMQKVATN